jgi:hypothetical protein
MNRMIGSIWNRTAVVAKMLLAAVRNNAPSFLNRAQSLLEKAKVQFANVQGKKPQLQKGLWWALGIIFVLQLYFVRELIAAEMLFGLGFAAFLFLGGVIYVLGTLGERGLAWSEAHARVVAQSARRGLNMVEELSRRSFRHPRSESAQ